MMKNQAHASASMIDVGKVRKHYLSWKKIIRLDLWIGLSSLRGFYLALMLQERNVANIIVLLKMWVLLKKNKTESKLKIIRHIRTKQVESIQRGLERTHLEKWTYQLLVKTEVTGILSKQYGACSCDEERLQFFGLSVRSFASIFGIPSI